MAFGQYRPGVRDRRRDPLGGEADTGAVASMAAAMSDRGPDGSTLCQLGMLELWLQAHGV
jgi:hypothetical protein